MSCCRPSLREVSGDALRHRDRARIGQGAIVEARAGDDVGDLADIGLGETQPAERQPDHRQVLDRDMRQDQVLLVAHPDLALAVEVGDVGDAFHLQRAGIARRRARRLQRNGDDAIARQAMGRHVGLQPQREVTVFELQRFHRAGHGRPMRQRRRRELAGDRLDGLGRKLQRAVLDLGILGLDFLAHLLGADLVHQDLYARLVEIVAPAVAVVDAQRRLEIGQKLVLGQELAQRLADHRRAAQPAAHDHLETDLPRLVAPQAQADVVHAHRGAVVGRAGDGDLELARQEAELGMQRRPLAHDLAPDARVLDLVEGGAGEMVGRDVADDIAGGLHGVHVDFGQRRQRVGRILELDPVELQVLARREMAVAAVVLAGDIGQLAQLARRQRAVGNGDAQHVGMELQVETVGETQRLELLLGELARRGGGAPGRGTARRARRPACGRSRRSGRNGCQA